MNDDDTIRLAIRAIHVASDRAQEVVLEYAATFDKRADYKPLEDLAMRVQGVVVVEAARVIREAEEEVSA